MDHTHTFPGTTHLFRFPRLKRNLVEALQLLIPWRYLSNDVSCEQQHRVVPSDVAHVSHLKAHLAEGRYKSGNITRV